MASGDTLLILLPRVMGRELVGTNSPAQGLINNHPVLSFDGSASESFYVGCVMPLSYNGGGVTVLIYWCSDDTAGQDVLWTTNFERIGDQDLDIDSSSFGSNTNNGNVTVPGISHAVDVHDIDHLLIDGVLAGESFRLYINRTAVSDTSSVDAHIVAVELRET